MKVSLRFPVLARTVESAGAQSRVVLALMKGDFDLPSPSDDRFPVEIDYLNREWDDRVLYRIDTDTDEFYKGGITLERAAKIEKKKFTLTYSDRHPMWGMMKDLLAEFDAMVSNGTPAHPRCARRYPHEHLDLEELGEVTLNSADVTLSRKAAAERLEGMRYVDGMLWKPVAEPFLCVWRGKPKWRAYPTSTYTMAMSDEIPYSMAEYAEAQAYIDGKVAIGHQKCETELRLGGHYEYKLDSLALNIVGVARATANYYANVTSEAGMRYPDQRLERHSVEMIEAYLVLRKTAAKPLHDVTDDDLADCVQAFETLRTEAKSLGIKPPIFSARSVADVTERWNDRPVNIALDAVSGGMKP